MARIEGMERPKTLLAHLAFFLSRRSYGRVITPARVYALDSGLLLAVGLMEEVQEWAKQTRAPVKRLVMVPCHTPQRRKSVFKSPVPLVSVRNSERKPMSPRDGTRNSMRTRPEPWLTIFIIRPLRAPSIWVTTPM